MNHIKDIVAEIIDDIAEKQKSAPAQLFRIWNERVSAHIRRHTKPYRFKKGILFVYTDSSPWAYELSQKHRQNLIILLNHELGAEVVLDIHFRVGDIKE